jgi:hypothetical protein
MSGRVTNVAVRGDAYRRTMRLVDLLATYPVALLVPT